MHSQNSNGRNWGPATESPRLFARAGTKFAGSGTTIRGYTNGRATAAQPPRHPPDQVSRDARALRPSPTGGRTYGPTELTWSPKPSLQCTVGHTVAEFLLSI